MDFKPINLCKQIKVQIVEAIFLKKINFCLIIKIMAQTTPRERSTKHSTSNFRTLKKPRKISKQKKKSYSIWRPH